GWTPSPLNMAVDWVGFTYAVLVTSGGLLGYVKAGTSGTLTVVMGLRFLSSGKFMPAGFMTIVSLLMLLKIISGVITRPRHF
ncbi:Transmembrane protein 14C, partial [Takifugu flavidus]